MWPRGAAARTACRASFRLSCIRNCLVGSLLLGIVNTTTTTPEPFMSSSIDVSERRISACRAASFSSAVAAASVAARRANSNAHHYASMQAFLSSCPIVSAIRQLAFADDPAPLWALLGRQPDVAVTPVQDPDYPTNNLPLHVVIAESCLTALDSCIPLAQGPRTCCTP